MSAAPLTLYDTTLRDGAQAEGVSFSASDKLRLVERLDTFGIHYVEGGYAGSNRKDMDFFAAARKLPLKHTRIVAFGSTRRANSRVQDDPFVRSMLEAETSVVTLYGKTWKLHVRDVLRTTLKENLAMIGDTIGYLKEQGRTVFFDAEHFFDGFKDDPDFAMRCLTAAVRAGADALILCDTNGGSLPHEVYAATHEAVTAAGASIGIHTHNDAGVAEANALEAVRAGAVQVQGTLNGYGERCGNANLVSLLPVLQLKLGRRCVTPTQLAKLRELSLFVDDLVNLRPDSRAPFVGASAFSHKGGPHVNAVRKNPITFEHIVPETVGNRRRVLISELSGGTNVLLKAIELGAGKTTSPEATREVLAALKNLESKGYAFEAADASFHMLIQKVLKEHQAFFDLEGFRVIVEKRGKDTPCVSEAAVKVRVRDEVEHTVAEGDGPVHALDRALRKALMRFYPEIAGVALTDFRVRILDPEDATAATTRVLIESSDGVETWGTVGVSENIIEAAWEALLDSVEYKLFREEEKRSGKKPKQAP